MALCFLTISFAVIACGHKGNKTTAEDQTNTMKVKNYEKGTFGYDLDFLQKKDTALVVLANGESQIIISPKYQAKVFTSTAQGKEGTSFGWINYSAFEGAQDGHMNAYGGENRFWLGPEGSKFSLFFKPKTEMTFENWKTPSAVDTEAWKVSQKANNKVSMEKAMSLVNYANSQLDILVKRNIHILKKSEIENLLNIELDSTDSVGFTTENSITNTGSNKWTAKTGAPCIWMLDMFTPSPKTVIVVPFDKDATGKIATTDYFGEISDDRISYSNGNILFKADGISRGKLGVPPQRAENRNGSYDPLNNILTVTLYDLDKNATYLNQEWSPHKDPLVGDAVNAYNDGPLEDGSQMGPFYEIESVSPAAFLSPNESLSHTHSVFHFTGNENRLNDISKKVLGLSLKEIESAF
ncbi:MAG: hypothetical protein CL868_13355 [Cytophagaceae bacterium]|nr:hypothetical protein [Cytophagaceae bacterium]